MQDIDNTALWSSRRKEVEKHKNLKECTFLKQVAATIAETVADFFIWKENQVSPVVLPFNLD